MAGACWDQFLFLTRERLGQGDQERALTALEPQEGFASFKDKLAGRSAEPSLQGLTRSIFNPASREVAGVLSKLDAKLRRWAGEERGLQRHLPLLELFNVILR